MSVTTTLNSLLPKTWSLTQTYLHSHGRVLVRRLNPYALAAYAAVQPLALPAAAALTVPVTVLLPATRMAPEIEVVQFLPADVTGELRKLEVSVNELESKARAVAKQVKPGPDALDSIDGGAGEGLAQLRRSNGKVEAGTAPAVTSVDCADFKNELTSANQRMKTLTKSLQLLGTTIDRRRTLSASMPLTRPVNGIVSSPFGWRSSPFNGEGKQHEGVDLVAPKGSTIVAPADGVVISVTPRSGYGRVILLDHGYGVTTVFAHLSRIDIKQGMHVKRGQPIAMVGTTGRTTGPHLHYEVRVDGRPVDPQPFLSFDLAAVQALATPGS